MTRIEFILHEMSSLLPEERVELTRQLLVQLFPNQGSDDAEVGLRGLNAWTESAQPDNWPAFYPPKLKCNDETVNS